MKDKKNNINLSGQTVSKEYKILALNELNSVSEAMGGIFSCGAGTDAVSCFVSALDP